MKLMSDAIDQIATALAKAQAEIEAAIEDKKNPHFKSSYASLYSIWQACRQAISKQGISVSQLTSFEGDMLILNTLLMHSSGQWLLSQMPVISAKMTPQAIGSAMTYMRRYGLAAAVGVAPGDDDDGQLAEDRGLTRESSIVRFKPNPIPSKDFGYDEFVKRLELDDPVKKRYISDIASKMKLSEVQVINSAMKKEESFLSAYEKWRVDQNANSPNPN